ncbi:uncharacterized protein LOC134530714 isoform X2 [Bacillus rossius redtenbacheri]|uniref:uncharacterized protein LOC134530714 isoform X2 n=1 Tax=Bacillus rossius redtenbacheri TaxID=93214 RepID=UPI002FDD2CCA
MWLALYARLNYFWKAFKDCLLEEFELALLGISPPGKMAAEAALCAQRDALAEDARRLRAALVFRNAEVESLRQQVNTFKALLMAGPGNPARSRMEECRPVGGHKSAPAVIAGCSRTTPCDGSVRRRR